MVLKGDPAPVEGVHVHGADAFTSLELPMADALLIHADMPGADALFELSPDRGVPLAFFQGYATPDKEVVHENLRRARHAICVSSWLVQEATTAGCPASLIRHGLDRSTFYAGPVADTRRPLVTMPTSPVPGKETVDGVAALRMVQEELPTTEFRLFGSADPGLEDATILASPPAQRFEIAELMREAAVFVCPSWEEGLDCPGSRRSHAARHLPPLTPRARVTMPCTDARRWSLRPGIRPRWPGASSICFGIPTCAEACPVTARPSWRGHIRIGTMPPRSF